METFAVHWDGHEGGPQKGRNFEFFGLMAEGRTESGSMAEALVKPDDGGRGCG